MRFLRTDPTSSLGHPSDDDVAEALASLSTREITAALRVEDVRGPLRSVLDAVVRLPSERLGKTLARFDRRVREIGVAAGARELLARFGVTIDVIGEPPLSGGLLVVTNHPGAYDAIATLAALGRQDVALVAAEREFLRAMPGMREHLIFVADEGTQARAFGVRRALAWLEKGHALIQFGAGAIEPDLPFIERYQVPLGPWQEGTGLFANRAARAGATVVPAFVAGVHSARAKRLFIVRMAEKRGAHTLAPMLQATLPGFRDVVVTVRFGEPIDRHALAQASDNARRTSLVRSAVMKLADEDAKARAAHRPKRPW